MLRDEARIELVAIADAGAESEVTGEDAELVLARTDVLGHIAIAAEFSDDVTHEHTGRVAAIAAVIARGHGLGEAGVAMIASAAMLHDIGKIAIPERILLKPGSLTAAERVVMRRHAQIGAAILGGSAVPELRLGEAIALSHHERWDGSGYPQGLAGDEIPIAARIAAIADVFDALVHERPYKPAWSLSDAVAEIASQRGRQFDPALVDVFLALDHRRLLDSPDGAAANARRAAIAAAIAPASLLA
jgi:putative two-component system response regulator